MSDYEEQAIVPRFAPRPKPTPIPTASVFDSPTKCLTINEFWLSHVLGVMEALDQFDTWIGTPEEVQAARDQVNEMIAAWSDDCGSGGLPGGLPIFRNNGFGMTEQLDDGAWVEPYGDYAFPPVPAREELTADERKCLAARNAVEVLAELYEAMTDQYAEEISPALGLAAILIAAGALFAFPFAPILGGILLLAELPFTIFYQGAEQLGSDLWNEEFSASLACVFLRNATDTAGVVHFDIEQIITELGLQINLLSPDGLDLRLYGQVNFLLRSVGSQGLDHAGTTTAITDHDCDDCGKWRACWRFAEGDMGAFEVTQVAGLDGSQWTGDGFQSKFADFTAAFGDNGVFLTFGRLFPSMSVQYVKAHFVAVDFDEGSLGGTLSMALIYDGTPFVADTSREGTFDLVWEGDFYFADPYHFAVNCALGYKHTSAGIAGGFARCTYIELRGTDIGAGNPFGDEQDCG